MRHTTPTEDLTATISFRLSEAERRTLAERASQEARTVSNFVRLHLRSLLVPDALIGVRLS
jgi:uncharacterized protein (DUF1778 family)